MGQFTDEQRRQIETRGEQDEHRLSRRSYLKFLGVAVGSVSATVASSDVARAASTGYGEAGYGEGGYGGTDSGPTVSTQSATDVGQTSATLPGSLDDLGGADSADCHFEWRQTGASSWNTTATQTLSSTGSFTHQLNGLADGAGYEYRAVAEASDGERSTASTVTFTTTDDSPAVSTGSPSNITDSSATLSGSLDDLGNATSADCYFGWREVGTSSWNTTATQTRSTIGSFSDDISGLSAGTDYEYAAVADASDADSDTGSTVTLTTESSPTAAPAIDSYSVTEAGSPNPHAEITAEWAVSDADGDLTTVSVVVTDSSGSTVDAVTTDVNGSTATGTETFKRKHANGQTFDVTLTVTDEAGNEVSQIQTVTE